MPDSDGNSLQEIKLVSLDAGSNKKNPSEYCNLVNLINEYYFVDNIPNDHLLVNVVEPC